MRFIDETRVSVIAGSGGNGAISWRREAHVPMGGPDGGDGGNGGAVVFAADTGLNTLIDFSFNPLIKAENGLPGGPNGQTGRSGKDSVVAVPVGTQVYYNDELIADIAQPGARWIAARGGHGGKGNAFFKTPTNRAPRFAQSGQEGETFEFRLVLKSVADVGLVGFPNAGKSTYVSTVSAAEPKVADYPFTTIRPSLGVVVLDDNRRFVIADIPGLIPGAHEGKGLGIQFLKHIERTKTLMQLVDVASSEEVLRAEASGEITDDVLKAAALEQFDAIDHELRSFSVELAERPRLVVFSKCDLELNQRALDLCQANLEGRGHQVLGISSVTGSGVKQSLEALYNLVRTGV
ncbi:MAG: GTPase ObgE [Bdellovibrionales bacterium]|nr:GTPase ObgE [Bdellovibrionales bacterium]